MEAELQNKIIKALKKHQPDVKVIKIHDKYTSGISDLIICHRGKFVAIELKVGNNKPTKLQELFLMQIEEAGGVVGVAYSIEDVERILKINLT